MKDIQSTTKYELKKFQGKDVMNHKLFQGAIYKTIQRLITGKNEDGIKLDLPRLPMSTKQLVEGRLGKLRKLTYATKADMSFLGFNFLDTCTAVLPNPNGNDVKFEHEHPLIYTLNPKTKLNSSYTLDITQEQYDSSKGFKLTAEQVNELKNNPYALPKVRRAFWEYQFEGDIQLTKDYITDVVRNLEMGFDYSMGLYLPLSKGLRLFSVCNVDSNHKSNAVSNGNLDYNSNCLVGVLTDPELVAEKTGIPLEELV